MRNSHGLTLLEILVALFVFGIVAAIATSGVTSALRTQAINEAVTSAQSKLRRITEVFTQELRSAVLGGVTNSPYASNNTQISFLLLDGGAGYQVVDKAGSFGTQFFTDLAPTGALSDVSYLDGREILMVNQNGEAVVMRVSGVTNNTSGSLTTYRLAHGACRNTIAFTPNTLVLSVRSYGISYDTTDASNPRLVQREGAAGAVPVAFDIAGFTLEYVYVTADGTPRTKTSPILSSGVPVRSGPDPVDGTTVTLTRVQMTVAADELRSGGESINRSYMGQVEMATNPSFQINRVRPCNA